MSMKKIIAGVAAAALTVGSLAVVGVSAESTTKTFNFVGKTGTMDVSYSKTIGYRGGIDRERVFALTDGKQYDISYALKLSMKDNYKDDNLSDVQSIVNGITASKGTVITVTGTTDLNKTITAKATAKIVKNSDNKAVSEYIRIRWEGESASMGATLESYDLDLSNMKTITSISVAADFSFSTGNYYVPEGTVNIAVDNKLTLVDSSSDFDANASYKSTSKDGNGALIGVNTIYAFEGTAGNAFDILDNQGWSQDANYGLKAISLGGNLLRWTNDNIIQNRGAKLRINFMTPAQLQDAISKGNLTVYSTADNQWASSSVLTPGVTSSQETVDIVMGVNLANTTKLQQATNIKDYVAEFDWDTLVQNSASTVSGNVDSIAFRINGDSDNVKWNLKDPKTGMLAIRSIEIVIPDQATVPNNPSNDPARILTAGSADCFVKLIGTDKSIYGNGAVEVAVENNITNSNVSYAVKLMDANGAYVQPGGEVTLQLSIPNDFRGATLTSNKVKHTCNDGTVEQLEIQNFETYKTDNYIVVKTSKFSDFEFGFETTAAEPDNTTEAPVETTTEAPVETTTEAPATEAPSNGNTSNGAASDKNAPTGVVLAVVPAAVAAAAVVISKKRK